MVPEAAPSHHSSALQPNGGGGYLSQTWAHLRAIPRSTVEERLRDTQFWRVQVLILGVTLIHIVFEAMEPSILGSAYFVPASLYLFPVLYASMNFGIEGALPTAVWCGVLSAPDIIVNHEGTARIGESFQVLMILVLSTLVAVRVDKETAARRASERSERERASSELKYRSLFENASEPILLFDERGRVRERNAAAGRLGQPVIRRLSTIVGKGSGPATKITSRSVGQDDPLEFCVHGKDGSDTWLQPMFSPQPGEHGEQLTQVLLRDVTVRHGLQRYAREIVQAQEDERRRIAQELHDVSVQSAILVCRQLDSAADSAPDQETKLAIRDARGVAETMADELRRFSRDLRPLILEDLGFVPALRRLAAEITERNGIVVRFDVRGDPRRLDANAELMLFRIGQEALRNVEHHSEATRAAVRLLFRPAEVCLRVTDNGVGFEVPSLTTLLNAGNLGLLGMQERARLVGGRCTIRSKPRAGTQVSAEIPA